MAVFHSGNMANALAFEEHDGVNNAKRVSIALAGAGLTSLPTIYAIVNTAASGQASVKIDGNVTISDSKGFIGLVTSVNGAGDRFIGLVTNVQAGLTTLAPSPNFIGITTIANQPPLVAGSAYVGLASVNIGGSLPALSVGANYIGLASINGSVVNLAGANFIGLATVVPGGNVTLNASAAFIGLVTVVIGNASVVTKNGGTTKTLQIFPVTISTGSAATVYVPTNKFYLTSLTLNSNSTVRVNVRSGATYLTGNASIGIELNPGSGFVELGSPDSPAYFGLANAAPVVIEKTDYSGVISRVSGKLVLFDE